MIKDYSNYSMFIGHLKELLSNFNMPLVPIYVDEERTPKLKNRFYIKDESIVKYNGSDFEFISSYNYGKEILNLTKKFLITSSVYDSYTHDYLGDYLRFLRDYNNVDLMCMYNCFFNQQPVAIDKSVKLEDGRFFKINTNDINYNYYVIKAKFNREYTIAVDCPFQFEITSILYDVNVIEQDDEYLINETYEKINGSTFKRPFVYTKLMNKDLNSRLWMKERDLKILIKLPKIIDSSIVVLEGNYKDAENVIDGVFLGQVKSCSDEDRQYFRKYSKLSLLNCNNKISYPFSHRLIEYLFGHAITSVDEITNNIERIQDNLYDNIINGYYGIFTDQTRSDIYKQTLKKDITQGVVFKNGEKKTKNIESNVIVKSANGISQSKKHSLRFIDNYYDVTNFIDKDVESLISLGVAKQDE